MGKSSADYIDYLRVELDEKRTFINEFVIDIVEESVSEYRKTFETVSNTMISADKIAKTLYGSSLQTGELKLPSAEPISPNSIKEELGIRLSDYLEQLNYLENYYEISLEYLNPERVRMLKLMFEFISWNSMSEASVSPNERALYEIQSSLSTDEDKLSCDIFRDSKRKLSELTFRILCGLEDISIYLREAYKLEVRDRVMVLADIDPETIKGHEDEAVLSIKKLFRTEMGENPFYTAFIKAILREDTGSQGEELKKTVIDNVKNHKTVIRIGDEGFDSENENDLVLLIEGFRLLGGAGSALINIADKLNLNADIVENRKLTFLQRLFTFFRKKPTVKKTQRTYTIIIFRPDDQSAHRVKIDFSKYISELTKEGQLLLSFGNKESRQMLDLDNVAAEQLISELKKHIRILYAALNRLPAVDRALRDKATNAMLGSMKGIKLDLNDIQSSIIKSNRRRLEHKTRLSGGFK
jgi:hypothetical protein